VVNFLKNKHEIFGELHGLKHRITPCNYVVKALKKVLMTRFLRITLAFIFIGFILSGCNDESRLFVGGFAKPGEKGMSLLDFNNRNGRLKIISQSDVGPNPTYFCYSAKRHLTYVLNEVMEFNGRFGGGLSTFSYDENSGAINKQGELLIPYGGPCFISMSPDSGFLFIASYPNGSVSVVKLDESGLPQTVTDTILFNKSAPDQSHAHMMKSDPSGKKIYVTDLGLDRITVYDFDKTSGKLSLCENGIIDLPRGSGPRHFEFNSDGSKMYLINELGKTIMVFNNDPNEGLKLIQTLPTIREGFISDNYCADIHLGKDGKYLYGSNRGENTIVTFSIGSDGKLTLAGHTSCGGDWPRNFTIDPSGKFILVGNQKSDTISVFKLDKNTGLPVEPSKRFPLKMPACLKFI
jgi:6-phosphogluconolactonase